jgi:hypothetical protein
MIFSSDKLAKPLLGTCNEIKCQFGAECELVGQTASCKCNRISICDEQFGSTKTNISKVCGSNKIKYKNECELKMHRCLTQEQINIERCL